MRARTNIALKNRYTATLTDFKGVDLNTSPLRVAQNRASSMKNFICDNGILHKRPGWEEQFRIFRSVKKTDADGNTVTDDLGNAVKEDVAQEIHAIFPFSEDGNEVLLIHAGTGIYRAEKKEGKWEYECRSDGITYINENRASCFYRGGKAYIAGCGNFLCYGKHDGESYTLCEVSEIAYVPTTTYGIGGSEEKDSLEPVNLLTRKRINTLTGSNKREESQDGEGNPIPGPFVEHFKLDSNVATNTAISVEGSCYFTQTDENGTQTFEIEFSETIVYDKDKSNYIYIPTDMAQGGLTATHCNGNILTATKEEKTCYCITITYNPQSSITFLSFYFPTGSIDGKPNITVTFSAEGGEGYAQRIKKCRFGTTFGVNDRHANERLFLAGNPDHPNMDFWSEANDFTYFPDGNTMEVGSAHAAINGYARLSDTTLAVLKEEKAGEPTIFYRTGAEKHDTANLKYDAYFPVAAGIAGGGIVNHHAGATLAGDVMVVTRSGVHALVLSSNVASGERYTRERSRPIYRELANSGELANAAGIVYRNRYYLALPDSGKCYVADAHYKATFDGSTDYNYEWWVWDNVHATCFTEYEDKLLFGTPDGLICAFVEGTFADRTFIELSAGDLLCDDCGGVIYNEKVKPTVGDRIVPEGGMYAKLGDIEKVEDGVLYTDDIGSYYEGQTVYADIEGQTVDADNEVAPGLLANTAYTVGDVDELNGTFCLRETNGLPYEEGSPVVPASANFRLLECLDGEELYVSAVNEEHGTFTVARGRSYLDGRETWNDLFLSPYNSNTDNWSGYYVHVSPVRAEWVTPIMDFGTNASAKTLLGFTVATEPGIGGLVTFGYETRRMEGGLLAKRAVSSNIDTHLGHNGLDFSEMDFDNFSFDASFACSFTRRMNLRNFNFIVFRFGSDIDQDCAVSGVTLQYKINRKNLGVR